MGTDKRELYYKLVQARKNCHLCNGLTNPSECNSGIYDSDQIGPWTLWQGNLDSKIMIIGQDWGDTKYFLENKGRDSNNNATNKTMIELFKLIGPDIG